MLQGVTKVSQRVLKGGSQQSTPISYPPQVRDCIRIITNTISNPRLHTLTRKSILVKSLKEEGGEQSTGLVLRLRVLLKYFPLEGYINMEGRRKGIYIILSEALDIEDPTHIRQKTTGSLILDSLPS